MAIRIRQIFKKGGRRNTSFPTADTISWARAQNTSSTPVFFLQTHHPFSTGNRTSVVQELYAKRRGKQSICSRRSQKVKQQVVSWWLLFCPYLCSGPPCHMPTLPHCVTGYVQKVASPTVSPLLHGTVISHTVTLKTSPSVKGQALWLAFTVLVRLPPVPPQLCSEGTVLLGSTSMPTHMLSSPESHSSGFLILF